MNNSTLKLCPAPWKSLSLSTSAYGPCCLYRLADGVYSYPSTALELHQLPIKKHLVSLHGEILRLHTLA